MDEDRLTIVRRHVAAGEARVRRQEAVLPELARDGRPTADAEALLETMRKTLELMLAELVELEGRAPERKKSRHEAG